MKTVTPEEAEQCDFVMCSRVSGAPSLEEMERSMGFMPEQLRQFLIAARKRSDVEQCSICAEDVWVDNVGSPRKPPRICIECAIEMEGSTRQ